MHKVDVTLEQLRALDALARTGTFAAAAAALGRGHTSVLYLIRTLEDALGFAVVDRSGYRTALSAHGRRVLAGARELLAAEADLTAMVRELRAGWEPTLTVVFDGIVRSSRCSTRSATWRASGRRPGSTCAPSSWPASRTPSPASAAT